MARSEIDDIFAEKKSTAKVITQPVAPTSISADTAGSKKKKKRKKREVSAEEAQDPGADEERPRKKRVVETILDPSTSAPLVPSSKVSQVGKGVRTTRPRGSKEQKEDLDRFIDSRGTGPRKWKASRYMR